MKDNYLIILLLGLVFMSCKNKEGDKPKSSFQEVYQMSGMALLMEDMYDELEKIRTNVISLNEIGEFPEKFNEIHTAEMTNSFKRTDEFNRFTELLLRNQKALYESKPDSARILLYNNVVKTCISCHKSDAGCIGPVSRIGKLLIKK